MAVIQVDFDAVMQFGGLHRNASTALNERRPVFHQDWFRLDHIVNEFALAHPTTTNPHFGSLTLAGADADARAGRTATTLMTTSTKVFQHAGTVQTANSPGDAIWAMSLELVNNVGGIIATGLRAAENVWGWRIPILSGVGLPFEIRDLVNAKDHWDRVAAAAQVAASAANIAVPFLVVGGVITMPMAGPILTAAAIAHLGGTIVTHRRSIGQAIDTGARWTKNAITGAAAQMWERGQQIIGWLQRGANSAVDKLVEVERRTAEYFRQLQPKAREIANDLLRVGELLGGSATAGLAQISGSTGNRIEQVYAGFDGVIGTFDASMEYFVSPHLVWKNGPIRAPHWSWNPNGQTPSGIRQMFGSSKTAGKISTGLGRVGTALTVINAARGGWKIGDGIYKGDLDQAVRGGIDVAWTVASLNPAVALGKVTWDVSWEAGKWIDRNLTFGTDRSFSDLSGEYVVDKYIREHHGGDPSKATDLGTRYDGVPGFFRWVGDSL